MNNEELTKLFEGVYTTSMAKALLVEAEAKGRREAIAALSCLKVNEAGAVVLSVEDAQALDSVLTTFRVGVRLEQGFDEHNKLRIAIEQARGKV